MKISENMMTDFNQTLENLNCCFRLKFIKEVNPICEIVPANDMFIHSSIINLTDEFYQILNDFFKKRGIELTYNNTGSIFWSKSGWEEEKNK